MHTKKYLATTLLTSSLVLGLMVGTANAQEKDLQPKSAWALTKVDRVAQGGNSYCTLSRQYDDDVVLSLARNQTEEYSLAIDFQKPVFDKDKSIKVNLQPGPGQIRAYDLMPTSDKAVVIRLGWDTGFFDALNQSQKLKATVSGKDYAFGLSEIAKGQADLQDCMNSIIASAKGPAATTAATDVLNAEPTAVSSQFAAQKVEDSAAKSKPPVAAFGAQQGQPVKEIAAAKPASKVADAAPVQSNFNAPKEPVVAAKTPVEPAAKLAATPVPVPEPVIVSAPEAPKENAEVKELRAKVAQLSQDKAAKEKAEQQAGQNAARLKQLETQVAQLTAQNSELQKTASVAAVTKQQNETLQAQVRSLQEEAAGNSKLTPAFVSPSDQAETDRLKKEVADLKAQLAAQPKQAVPPAATPAAESLAKEVESLKAQNKTLQDQLAAQAKNPAAVQAAASPADAKALADAQARVKELEAKNAQLEDTLRQSQTRIAETAINTEGAALRKIADLENKLEAAKADNASLAKQLDGVRLQQEDKRLSLVAGDWDLEKATKRFNEAEREIRRLGQQLEQERTSCNREKAQIENMLFDPAVTEQKQIEKLASLEAQLKAAQDKLAGRISQTGMSPDPASLAPAAGGDTTGLQEAIAQLRQENDALRDQNIVLKNAADKAHIQLTDIQSNGAVRADNVASAKLQAEEVRRQLSLKDSQNEALQNRINMLQKENTDIKNRLSLTQEAAAAATAASYTNAGLPAVTPAPRAPTRAPYRDEGDDKITSGIRDQRERLNRSGDPSAAKLASMNPAAGGTAAKAQPAVAGGYDARSIQTLLQKAGLSTDTVKKSAVGMEGAQNFSWTDQANANVRGVASVKSISAPSEFEGTVQEYITNQKAMCPGDFASIPSDNFGSASKKMALYEIACVSGSTSSSASVVFFEDQGRFIAVANQTSAEDMDEAMDSRDRVANFVRGL